MHRWQLLTTALCIWPILGCGQNPPTAQTTANEDKARESATPKLRPDEPMPSLDPAVVNRVVAEHEWQPTSRTEDDFTVDLPGNPKRTVATAPTRFGDVTMVTQTLDRGDIVFSVTTTTYTEEFLRNSGVARGDILTKGADAGVASKRGTLNHRKTHQFNGQDALDQTFSYHEGVNSEGGEFPEGLTMHRVVLVGNRMYLLQIDVARTYYDANASDVLDVRTRFFDSLRL